MRAGLVIASLAAAQAFRSYPLFKQCDPAWGSNQMGVAGNGERSNICGEGCAMSSLSMALNGLGVPINGDAANPGTFNSWLEANSGYLCLDGDCNNLVLNAVSNLNATIQLVGEQPKPSIQEIQAGLLQGDTIYIAHVHNNGHFVLLTGFDASAPDSFDVNDAFYNSTSYPYANITDILVYSITPANAAVAHRAATRAKTQTLRRHSKPAAAVATGPAANRFGPAGTLSIRSFEATRPSAEVVAAATPEVAVASPVIPFQYPLYKQCDPRWGSFIMQTVTICDVGCLMSSTSMAIGGKRISISNATSTPGTLNAFLRKVGGYVGDNDMSEAAVPEVNPTHIQWSDSTGMHTTNNIPLAGIHALLQKGSPVIANVMQGHHFVLVTGWDAAQPDTLMVNDPGFDRQTYSYKGDVVGWRLFEMEMA